VAGNFVCPDPEIVTIAEQARRDSARFWTGNDLPGNWSAPCPIRVTNRLPEGTGVSRFRFENGEVFGWQMEVSGSTVTLQQDVLPHEVDHLVRASLVRHPVERWLDEGCASLMESAESHQRLRQFAQQLPVEFPSLEWLQQTQNPRTPQELTRLYSGGFSLVEFLLSRGDPARLLAFQRDSDGITNRLARHYQLTPESLRTEWHAWRDRTPTVDCLARRCPRPHHVPAAATLTPLTVWTADWCPACKRFQQQYLENDHFRQTLDQHFCVERKNADQFSAEAHIAGVQVFPTFQTPFARIEGFSNPNHLLRQLGIETGSTENRLIPVSDTVQPASPPFTVPFDPVLIPPELPPSNEPSSVSHPDSNPASFPLNPLLPLLQWGGLLGGSVATGGVAGVAVSLFFAMLRSRRTATSRTVEGSAGDVPAPFPRQLDEARQLLALRQSEGRVAVLDAIRGLFLDDELQRFEASENPTQSQVARLLRETIDARVAEVAPLTVQVPSQMGDKD